jgi:hypothetical protein
LSFLNNFTAITENTVVKIKLALMQNSLNDKRFSPQFNYGGFEEFAGASR